MVSFDVGTSNIEVVRLELERLNHDLETSFVCIKV